jgi:chaperonin GroEL
MQTTLELVEGLKIDKGYVSPRFINNKEKMSVELTNPYIIIYDKKISTMQPFVHILEKIVEVKGSLLFIADDIDKDALATLIVNNMKGNLPCCAIRTPGFGDLRMPILEDIAAITGAVVVSEETGISPEQLSIENLGRAQKVKITKDSTIIIDGAGKEEDVEERLAEIRVLLEENLSDFEKEKLQERAARLSGGVAVIRVGAMTELELKEKKARIEDAMYATKAATEEGIVPGGGVAFLRAIPMVEKLMKHLKNDYALGANIIVKALESPCYHIALNAGEEGRSIVEKIKRSKDKYYGYNADTEEYCDLIKDGVVDPAKVSKTALQNAASIAGLLLTTECLVTDIVQPMAGQYGDILAGTGLPMHM